MVIYHWDSRKLSEIHAYDHRGSLLDMTRMYGYLQDLKMNKNHVLNDWWVPYKGEVPSNQERYKG